MFHSRSSSQCVQASGSEQLAEEEPESEISPVSEQQNTEVLGGSEEQMSGSGNMPDSVLDWDIW